MTRFAWKKVLPAAAAAILLAGALTLFMTDENSLPGLHALTVRETDRAAAVAVQIADLQQALAEQSLELEAFRRRRELGSSGDDAAAVARFRTAIENAADTAAAQLQSMGDIGRIDHGAELAVFEVSISVTGNMAEITDMLEALHHSRPRLFWRFMRLNAGQRNSDRPLTLSGSVQCYHFPGKGPR